MIDEKILRSSDSSCATNSTVSSNSSSSLSLDRSDRSDNGIINDNVMKDRLCVSERYDRTCTAPVIDSSSDHTDSRFHLTASDRYDYGAVGVAGGRYYAPAIVLQRQRQRQRQNGSHQHQHQRQVRFGNLQVREYPIMLGDNPSCSSGPPLTIEWNHTKEEVIPVGIYEFQRSLSTTATANNNGKQTSTRFQSSSSSSNTGRRSKRRHGLELKTSHIERERKLKTNCQHLTNDEIEQVTKEVSKIQKLRQQTIQRQKFESMSLMAETVSKSMKKRWLFLKSSSSQNKQN